MSDLVLPQRLDDETIVPSLRELLARRPDARAIAIDADTLEDRPDALRSADFDPGQVVSGMEQVARVAPVDQARMVSHSLRVAEEGAIVETVTLVDGTVAAAGLYDLRATLGVFVGVLLPLDGLAADELTTRRAPVLPARVGRVRIGPLGAVVQADAASAELLSRDGPDASALNAFDIVHPDDRRALVECFIAARGAPDGTDRGRGRLLRGDGSYLWTEISFRRVDDEEGSLTELELVDISSEMAEHEKLVEREQLLDGLTRSLPVGVLQIDTDGAVRFSNRAVGHLTGVERPTSTADAFANVVKEERAELDAAVERALRHGADEDIEVRLAPAPGVPDVICSLIIRPLTGDDGLAHGAVICVQDVTGQAMARADLETRIMLDPLTRSLNRDGIMDRLSRCLGASPDGTPAPLGAVSATTVIYIDLDHFKQVNDRFGHRAGDTLLRTATERIRGALRDGDVVGRIGGDEFVAICPGVAAAHEAMAIADRVADRLAEPIPDEPAQLRASIGVVTALAGDSRSAEALLADGDAAMYRSKRAGRGRPVRSSSSIA